MSKLRILALHGGGTSAEIWRAQSGSFRDHLPKEWDFEFLDGEQEVDAADGVSGIYPAPYYAYYSIPTYTSVQAAHALIHEVIEEEGPFDGVFGFSQGAALAASVILHHQDENPFASPLFRFAIFFNGSLPFSKTSKLGVDVSQIFAECQSRPSPRVFTPIDDDDVTEYVWEQEWLNKVPVRRFSPRTHKDRIAIPTCHLFGRNDQFRLQSLQLMKLCHADKVSCFEHAGAHDVPRSKEQSRTIAKTIMKTVDKAIFVSV